MTNVDMELAYAGIFTLTELFDLASYEYEQGRLIKSISITSEQEEALKRELQPLIPKKDDDRPRLVKHMYPKKLNFTLEYIHSPFNEIKIWKHDD